MPININMLKSAAACQNLPALCWLLGITDEVDKTLDNQLRFGPNGESVYSQLINAKDLDYSLKYSLLINMLGTAPAIYDLDHQNARIYLLQTVIKANNINLLELVLRARNSKYEPLVNINETSWSQITPLDYANFQVNLNTVHSRIPISIRLFGGYPYDSMEHAIIRDDIEYLHLHIDTVLKRLRNKTSDNEQSIIELALKHDSLDAVKFMLAECAKRGETDLITKLKDIILCSDNHKLVINAFYCFDLYNANDEWNDDLLLRLTNNLYMMLAHSQKVLSEIFRILDPQYVVKIFNSKVLQFEYRDLILAGAETLNIELIELCLTTDYQFSLPDLREVFFTIVCLNFTEQKDKSIVFSIAKKLIDKINEMDLLSSLFDNSAMLRCGSVTFAIMTYLLSKIHSDWKSDVYPFLEKAIAARHLNLAIAIIYHEKFTDLYNEKLSELLMCANRSDFISLIECLLTSPKNINRRKKNAEEMILTDIQPFVHACYILPSESLLRAIKLYCYAYPNFNMIDTQHSGDGKSTYRTSVLQILIERNHQEAINFIIDNYNVKFDASSSSRLIMNEAIIRKNWVLIERLLKASNYMQKLFFDADQIKLLVGSNDEGTIKNLLRLSIKYPANNAFLTISREVKFLRRDIKHWLDLSDFNTAELQEFYKHLYSMVCKNAYPHLNPQMILNACINELQIPGADSYVPPALYKLLFQLNQQSFQDLLIRSVLVENNFLERFENVIGLNKIAKYAFFDPAIVYIRIDADCGKRALSGFAGEFEPLSADESEKLENMLKQIQISMQDNKCTPLLGTNSIGTLFSPQASATSPIQNSSASTVQPEGSAVKIISHNL